MIAPHGFQSFFFEQIHAPVVQARILPAKDSEPPLERIGPGEVHFWQFSRDRFAPGFLESAQHLVTLDERQHAGRFKFEKDRLRFISARAILRVLLGRYLNVAPVSVEFALRTNGKPVLFVPQNETQIHFNISHSDAVSVLCFSVDGPIGVDVEQVRRADDLADVAATQLGPYELAVLDNLSAGAWFDGFFRAWTEKEALSKMSGEGIGNGMPDFDAYADPGAPTQFRDLPTQNAAMCSFSPMAGYWAAIAQAKAPKKLHFAQILPETHH